ncbi:Amino-acid permease RocE [compost metagenome]
MMFSLSRGGYAPRALGLLNRRGVPTRAIAVSCAGIAVAMVLNVWEPEKSLIWMMAISMFGAMFTWFMVFVTHGFFRARWKAEGSRPLAFRMWGFPWFTLLGGTLMLGVLITTYFTAEFHLTLLTGLPFLGFLLLVYAVWYRRR